MIHYGVTKTMKVALTRGLAETTAGAGGIANSLQADPTRSEGAEKFLSDMAHTRGVSVAEIEREIFRSVRPTSLLQRFESVDEVAAMVAS
jgi:NAD(P)-dependent dehydrogenase (short-subunit alcohol dehydrogenase family)